MGILTLLFALVIWGIIFWVLWWGLRTIAPPEPWGKVATVILVLATVYVLVGLLMGTIPVFPFLVRA